MADTEEEKQNTTKQLEESEKKLAGLKVNLTKEQSGTSSASGSGPVGEEFQLIEFNGHRFKSNTFDTDLHCHSCGEPLLNRHGLFCFGCDYICHKECHTLGGVSCSERNDLKSVPPLIFQAQDAEERAKWIDGINTVRDTYIKNKAEQK